VNEEFQEETGVMGEGDRQVIKNTSITLLKINMFLGESGSTGIKGISGDCTHCSPARLPPGY